MKKELSLYIHIPFCVRKCAYCDFLSFPAGEEVREQYVEALIQEIKTYSQKEVIPESVEKAVVIPVSKSIAKIKNETIVKPMNLETNSQDASSLVMDQAVVSVFIGGGTPSVLEPKQIQKIMKTVFECYNVLPDAEITIEANPGTVDFEKLKAYKECGINRISFGLQSANDEELKLLGRIHSFAQFEKNFHLARKAGFENISVDLMSALPKQTLESWKHTLQKVVNLSPEHISAYSLIIEEGTPFYEAYKEEDERRAGGEDTKILPNEDTERAITDWTKEYLESHGYHQYEISNFGKQGKESVHNIGYWIRREYVGFGLGAASLIENVRYANSSSMEEYLSKGRDAQEIQPLLQKECMEEQMFLGLRMTEGVSKPLFLEAFGQAIEEVYGDVLQELKEQGLLEEDDQRVWLTPRGMDISNYCMAEFLLE